jgi:hypothetical protein
MQYLIITSDVGNIDWKTKGEVLKEEAQYIWDLSIKGIVRNIWFTQETKDAILIIEAESEQQVIETMKNAPLVIEGLLGYKIVGLQAYTGFERLFHGTD